ncbi:MAG: prepilin-type N-terminal cleavage/methylation domain-containing protein [Candidatus Coatesbacteria bacterium]
MNRHGRESRRRGETGFTLIELMIVVAIIGVLAAMAIPKFALMIERSRESTTRATIASIRGAIALYHSEEGGDFPVSIEPVPANGFSRYLEVLPPVKASHAGIGSGLAESPSGTAVLYTTDEVITSTGRGWRYNPKNGHLFVNSSATDSKAIAYSTYGY